MLWIIIKWWVWIFINWWVNLFVSFDQLLNTFCGGEPDNTISARVGFFAREMEYDVPFKNFKKRYWKIIETIVDFTWKPVSRSNHCLEAYLADADEEYKDNNWWVFLIPMSLLIFIICILLIIIFYPASFIWGLFRFKKEKTIQSTNKISIKVKARLIKGIKKYRNVLRVSEQIGINKYNTATIILDMSGEIFGYDKYSEITSDFDIKKTSCVIAVKNGKKLEFLIEVYPIKFDLKRVSNIQLADYEQYQDVDRVIVTNGINWKVFKIKGEQVPTLLVEFNFLRLEPKKPEGIELLYHLSKEYSGESVLKEHRGE